MLLQDVLDMKIGKCTNLLFDLETIEITSHYLVFMINIIRIKIKTLFYLSYYKQIKIQYTKMEKL